MKGVWKDVQRSFKTFDADYTEVDGTWFLEVEGDGGTGQSLLSHMLKMEIVEGTGDTKETKRHDVRFDYCKLDRYASVFRRGNIFKYVCLVPGVPTDTKLIGTFAISVSPHRPMVSKEYMAFQ
jgi:hypothetical protein